MVIGPLDRCGRGMLPPARQPPKWTADMVPMLLRELKAKGYEVVHMVPGPGTGRTAPAPAGFRRRGETAPCGRGFGHPQPEPAFGRRGQPAAGGIVRRGATPPQAWSFAQFATRIILPVEVFGRSATN